MNSRMFVAYGGSFFLGAIFLAGCGNPEFAQVKGLVTMDGQPLKEAQVWFECSGHRAALGVTDEAGRYEVRSSGKQMGAPIGRNTVRVETSLWYDDGTPIKGAIIVPTKYRENSELAADVVAGDNELNFALEGGKIQTIGR